MAATQSGHKAGGATAVAGSGHRHDKGGGGQGPVKPVPNFDRHDSFSSGVVSPSITRSEVIERAKSWVGKGLDYSGSDSYQGYRTDCSGYVSMAWHLSDSETTDTFIPNGVAEWISKDDLKPGDVLLNDASGPHGHVVLFESWTSSAHDEYSGYEFTPSGVHHRNIPYPYSPGYGTFKPARLKNIKDDAVTPEIDRRDVATRIHGDFNGDGHDDVAAFYGYHDGSTALFTFKGDGRGG
ncbi:VCBS repeat-containing protein, partial [Streptomyces sp. NPDC020801]